MTQGSSQSSSGFRKDDSQGSERKLRLRPHTRILSPEPVLWSLVVLLCLWRMTLLAGPAVLVLVVLVLPGSLCAAQDGGEETSL